MSFNIYQPFLDYGLVPNPAVIFPTVIDNYRWEIFKGVAKDYHLSLKEFRAKDGRSSGNDLDQYQGELFVSSILSKGYNSCKNPRILCPYSSPSTAPDTWI